jgi:hypothetical protein
MLRPLVLAFTATVAFACSWDYPIWIPRSKSADPLYRFVKNEKAGYIDGSGRVVIPPTFEPYGNYGSEFHDGLLEIGFSDGRYLDRTGKVVVDKGYYRGWDFSEGLAVAMRKGRISGATSTPRGSSQSVRGLRVHRTIMSSRSLMGWR